MRMVTAIIQPTKLVVVREALATLGVEHLTVLDAEGYARQRGQTAMYRGLEYQVDLLRKIVIEVVIQDEALEAVLEVLRESALTGSEGQIGDGKIFVLPVVDAIRISDGTSGHTIADHVQQREA
ncbi:P-II family nitrogen regulator [Roseimaritima ulvae]|uniref:Nitrogen regulatory protein P-II n=1 Tax=Roseimaritima ulvae TaxID=980254 RepID=A0A5B9QY10_9BACT|nr:P-II family nitrogen regulator [Roseimaritima ulvae]QEG42285.1 Nitrogen regulatory protein P-II [Roseimaritima ulvae]